MVLEEIVEQYHHGPTLQMPLRPSLRMIGYHSVEHPGSDNNARCGRGRGKA